jgi:hypothetical protein
VTGSGARIVPRLLPERPDEPVETVPAISGGHPSPRKNQRRLAMTPYLASRRDTREICEIPYLSGGEAPRSLSHGRKKINFWGTPDIFRSHFTTNTD